MPTWVRSLGIVVLVDLSAWACSSKLPDLRSETFETEPGTPAPGDGGGAVGGSNPSGSTDGGVGGADNGADNGSGADIGAAGIGAAGVPSSNPDACPLDPDKIEPGACGCGVSELDSDGDSEPNCDDACPDDPQKIERGECGCGVEDVLDANDDPLCLDECPDDPDKALPGACECGTPDTDSDGDGAADCVDECPSDAQKSALGICGCGIPDTRDDSEQHECVNLRDALRHRYSFNGSSADLTDSVGQAHGLAMNTALSGDGYLELQGAGSDQYADLPDALLSGSQDVSLEFWVIWRGGAAWQRVFDFGQSSAGEGLQGDGLGYLMFTPRNTEGLAEVAFLRPGMTETILNSGPVLEEMLTHVVVVFEDDTALSLFKNGVMVATRQIAGSLTDLSFVNTWLGRSQFGVDDDFNGILQEFRVYDGALTDAQVQVSNAAGPEAVFPVFN